MFVQFLHLCSSFIFCLTLKKTRDTSTIRQQNSEAFNLSQPAKHIPQPSQDWICSYTSLRETGESQALKTGSWQADKLAALVRKP